MPSGVPLSLTKSYDRQHMVEKIGSQFFGQCFIDCEDNHFGPPLDFTFPNTVTLQAA